MNMTETSQEMDDQQPQDTSADEAGSEVNLRSLIEAKNIADGMDKEDLEKISAQVSDGFEADLKTRQDWETNLDGWTKLALQVKEEKSWPWQNAANVKYPLLSTAAMQFNARSYPTLVPSSGDIVKVETIGFDLDGQKLERAKRVGKFMSYQVLNQMEGWEEDMDKLLIMLPIVGTMFKKTYYNPVLKQNCSELILPKSLVVNYWAKSLESAERVSEILEMSPRIVKEKQMSGIFLNDVELGEPQMWDLEVKAPIQRDETVPYQIIEQHTYLDLDDDEYSEPYVVTFERFTKKILRITARFDDTTMHLGDDGELQKIDPIQYYTKFSFIPNPDGGFYDIGFGLLLSPLNESVNTIINQLLDAGTLSNLQGGFLGKGIKLKMGESRWTPGEWKTINSTADDLRKQVVPLPTKEPSAVLFQLMGTLVTSGKELASVAEIFVGKMPGQNTPATTTMATIEQGMKVFTAVYKRVYRSLKSEFKKIFALNKVYLDPQQYAMVDDTKVSPDDFDSEGYDVCPGADPNTATQTEKLMKAQGLMELLPIGVLDPVKVVLRILEAQEQPNYEQLLTQQVAQTGQFQPPPDPKMLELQMKSESDQKKFAMDQQAQAMKSELAQRDQAFQHMMQMSQQQADERHEAMMTQIKAASTLHMDQARVQSAKAQTQQAMAMSNQQHQQKMQQNEETHQSKIQMMKAQARAKPSKTGSKAK